MFSEKVHVMNHPLVAHKLTILRDKNTSVKDFRELVSEIGMLITYEATRDLPLTTKVVETPLCKAELPTLAGKKFAVVPILRAGLGLVDGVLRMVPSARVGHIGMYRDEETLEPHPYFCKMPKDVADRDIIIVDPMLATGGSAMVRAAYSSGTPAIGVGPNMTRWMTDRMLAKATERQIPYQLEVMSGHTGTNGWEMQISREGVATSVLSLPLKYMHSPIEVLSLADMEQVAALLVAFTEGLGKEAARR